MMKFNNSNKAIFISIKSKTKWPRRWHRFQNIVGLILQHPRYKWETLETHFQSKLRFNILQTFYMYTVICRYESLHKWRHRVDRFLNFKQLQKPFTVIFFLSRHSAVKMIEFIICFGKQDNGRKNFC
jgi:hypothetical protein